MSDAIIFTDINSAPGFGRYGGAYRIASELRSHGYMCQVIEFFSELSFQDICKVFDNFLNHNTKIVGFATTLWVKNEKNMVDLWTNEKRPIRFVVADLNKHLFPHEEDFMREVFFEIKLRNRNTKIVLGGYKAKRSQFYDVYPEVDHWIHGEGETPIIEIMESIHSGKVLKSPFKEFAKSQTLWQKEDIILPNEHLPIEVARGCIFKCAFCSFDLNGKKPGEYIKSIDILRAEIMHNYENYGTTGYMISDDTLNDSPEKIEALHKMITSLPFKFEFSSYLRLDLVHRYPQMVELLYEMGIRSCQLGIETLNYKTGKAIGKGLHPDKQKEMLYEMKRVWKDDVYIGAGFIIGLKYETPNTCKQWLDWLDQENTPLDSCQVVPLIVQKESKVGEDPELWQYGKNISENEAKRITYNFYNGGHKRKRNLTSFHFYTRMRNLGYTHKECGNMYMNNVNIILESEVRRNKLKDQYFERLYSESLKTRV